VNEQSCLNFYDAVRFELYRSPRYFLSRCPTPSRGTSSIVSFLSVLWGTRKERHGSNTIMVDSAVVVKTRKFKKNPLLSRKQVRETMALAAFDGARGVAAPGIDRQPPRSPSSMSCRSWNERWIPSVEERCISRLHCARLLTSPPSMSLRLRLTVHR
jgi:hypothetical protein